MVRGSGSQKGTGDPKNKPINAQIVRKVQGSLGRQWESMPKSSAPFLLDTPLDSLDLHAFAKFWSSSPALLEHTRSNGAAGRLRDASYSMAINYLNCGKIEQARRLMLNGSFIMACIHMQMDTILQWSRKNPNLRCPPQLKLFIHALELKPAMMQGYIQRMQRMFCVSSQKAVVDHVGRTGDSTTKIHQRSSSSSSSSSNVSKEETQIQLILVDDSNVEERHILNIGSSTTLKKLFNDYAEKRGVSLRSLRFSYNDKTLFLSTVGNKTSDEMKLNDQDIITVHNTNNNISTPESESSSSSSAKKKKATTRRQAKQRHNYNNPTKKMKGNNKSKKKIHDKNKDASITTLGEYKTRHSKLLTKLHDEVQSQLKDIRSRLNSLDLERQPPKKKRKNKSKKKNVTGNDAVCQMILPNSGLGGKAGKSYFGVQVGEVQNLYKTTKLLALQKSSCSNTSTTLDLHGYTVDEALLKLDATLNIWVNTAMRGSYPFVIQATIICGCGCQILSETVEKWIRTHDQVANSPKGFIRQ